MNRIALIKVEIRLPKVNKLSRDFCFDDCNVVGAVSGVEICQFQMTGNRVCGPGGTTWGQRGPRGLHPVAQDVDARILTFGETHFRLKIEKKIEYDLFSER